MHVETETLFCPLQFRVWPDGTVHSVDESPYQWMSDDFVEVTAENEEGAVRYAREKGYC